MANNRVFISAPISVDWSTVTEFVHSVLDAGGKPVFWDRNTRYDQNDFNSSDSVVFILPKNKFEMSQYGLPIGLKNELSRAFEMNKDIYIGYITSNGNHSIFSSSTDGKNITGVSATTGSLKRSLETIKTAEIDAHNKNLREIKKIAANSQYGVFVENPWAEVKFPTVRRVFEKTISATIYEECVGYDKRLLLMI